MIVEQIGDRVNSRKHIRRIKKRVTKRERMLIQSKQLVVRHDGHAVQGGVDTELKIRNAGLSSMIDFAHWDFERM
jgi:hypothetical protein